ncbi:hypothetical protein ACRYCC_38520 [Actinomadura scrupuli]|uniref:hypothetical protein n=1 Tax=Actinomadura scrupuli TaxID=559629 RepID=UPI003D973DD1
MHSTSFQAGSTYDNVYLLFVDASGYSNIVDSNPRDKVTHAFDLLRESIIARVMALAEEHHCARAALWSWRGDGGFFAIHDDSESIARDVALGAGVGVLRTDRDHVCDELKRIGIQGDLHIRVAVHKGAVRYSGGNGTGSIHSPDINFAAHLEKVTPTDCLAISEAVFKVAGHHAESFEPVGSHQDQTIHLMSVTGRSGDGRRAWLTKSGLGGGTLLHAYPERPSQREKARLIDVASADIIDIGTALNTCSNYLVTTERPATYRDAVLRFLRRGGTYRCVLLDSTAEVTSIYSRLRREDLTAKIKRALDRFAHFKEAHGADADGLHVYQAADFPGLAALGIDLDSPLGLVLYSPYVFATGEGGRRIERGDMPHYLISSDSGPLFDRIRSVLAGSTFLDERHRVL